MQDYHDELWDEIPGYAFIALGRRGREQISLFECFVPGCESVGMEGIHPIKKIETSEKTEDGKWISEKNKYLMYCETCQQSFHLVFERKRCLDEKMVADGREEVFMERVYATDGEDQENYGEIGFVQQK